MNCEFGRCTIVGPPRTFSTRTDAGIRSVNEITNGHSRLHNKDDVREKRKTVGETKSNARRVCVQYIRETASCFNIVNS